VARRVDRATAAAATILRMTQNLQSYPGTRQPSKIGDPVNEEMHAPRYELRKPSEDHGRISTTSIIEVSTPPK
jgi:hypothetical protein